MASSLVTPFAGNSNLLVSSNFNAIKKAIEEENERRKKEDEEARAIAGPKIDLMPYYSPMASVANNNGELNAGKNAYKDISDVYANPYNAMKNEDMAANILNSSYQQSNAPGLTKSAQDMYSLMMRNAGLAAGKVSNASMASGLNNVAAKRLGSLSMQSSTRDAASRAQLASEQEKENLRKLSLQGINQYIGNTASGSGSLADILAANSGSYRDMGMSQLENQNDITRQAMNLNNSLAAGQAANQERFQNALIAAGGTTLGGLLSNFSKK